MEILERLREKLDRLERKNFYIYIGIFYSAFLLFVSLLVFYYYSSTNQLLSNIEMINEEREETVRRVLSRNSVVKKQRKEVNDLLKKEGSFKIAGYFNDLLKKQGLLDKKKEESTSQVDLQNEYREVMLSAQFDMMTMQQLCELIDQLEKKKRIYTKLLEINRSKKSPKTIEVRLTIATLQPKKEKI